MITVHPEEVKAKIRIAFGSFAVFAEAHGLNDQQIRDCLRGMSVTAKPAIAELLGVDPDQLHISRNSTAVESASSKPAAPHRLNAEAR